MKKEKGICARFVLTPQTAEVTAPVCTEVRVKDAKGITFVGTENVLHQEASSLDEDLRDPL